MSIFHTYDLSYKSSNTLVTTKILNIQIQEGEEPIQLKSTFTICIAPKEDYAPASQAVALIDGIPIKKGLFGLRQNLQPVEILQEFHMWAPDVPPDFYRKVGDYIGSNFNIAEREIKKVVEGVVDAGTNGLAGRIKGRIEKTTKTGKK